MSELSRVVAPGLSELLRKKQTETKVSLNCVSIGKIVNFYSEDQTADIQLSFLRQLRNAAFDGNDQPIDKTIPYPVLVKCPVVVLNGGGAYISFPIEAGDQCLVLFCDRDLDAWWSSGQTMAPPSNRVHDLSDGIALVGVFSKPAALDYYTDGIKIKLGNGIITMDKSGLVTIDATNVVIKGTTVSINPLI